jgi:predicted negative regulator of RcsB-dependent stress response
VDDYLSEKEQWEWLKGWVRSNGLWIVAGILVGIGILLGWRWWQARTDRIALEAGAKYQLILEAMDKGDKTRAQTITSELERDYASSPYVDQANLIAARGAVESNELDKAAGILKSTMEKTQDPQLALVARLRLARVQLAQNKADEAIATLNAVDAGAFKPRFAEARGDALLAKGDKPGALKEYQNAREGLNTQSVDAQALDLKIGDLTADNVVVPAPPPATVDAKPAATK